MTTPDRKTYHIVVSEFIVGEISIYISETEPTAYSSRVETGNANGDAYYIYSSLNIHTGIAIDIGRAVNDYERKGNKSKTQNE